MNQVARWSLASSFRRTTAASSFLAVVGRQQQALVAATPKALSCFVVAATTTTDRPSTTRWLSTDSITYSGGQPTTGQGGYYGSGGARATGEHQHQEDYDPANSATESERTKVLAMAADVQTIAAVMNEVSTLESLLEKEDDNPSKAMEIRNAIKKLMTSTEVTSALNRLHVQGEPVWGLSVSEREMITYAREKVNEC